MIEVPRTIPYLPQSSLDITKTTFTGGTHFSSAFAPIHIKNLGEIRGLNLKNEEAVVFGLNFTVKLNNKVYAYAIHPQSKQRSKISYQGICYGIVDCRVHNQLLVINAISIRPISGYSFSGHCNGTTDPKLRKFFVEDNFLKQKTFKRKIISAGLNYFFSTYSEEYHKGVHFRNLLVELLDPKDAISADLVKKLIYNNEPTKSLINRLSLISRLKKLASEGKIDLSKSTLSKITSLVSLQNYWPNDRSTAFLKVLSDINDN